MIQPLNEGTQRFLKALASETRQQIMLTFAGGESLTVGEVATRCALGQSTASEQLSLLRQGGLLTAVKQGKSVRYSADAESIRSSLGELQDYLARCC
ncbi:ArsR/SmtB family transcription factor [Arthrobacter sp. SA17]